MQPFWSAYNSIDELSKNLAHQSTDLILIAKELDQLTLDSVNCIDRICIRRCHEDTQPIAQALSSIPSSCGTHPLKALL